MKAPLLIASFASAILAAGCGPAQQTQDSPEIKVSGSTLTVPPDSPQHSAISVEPVESGQPVRLPLAGRLVWDDDCTARVFVPFAGIVRKLLIEVNGTVTNGMPLAEIQSADFGQAQADARKAESDFQRTQRNFSRLQELFEHGAAPRKDLDSAEADFASSQAERDRAAQRLAIYGVLPTSTNRDFLLPSPLSGVLVERNVTPGQEVRPDQMLANMPQITAPLFVITDPTRLWVLIDASEADLPHLQPGQKFNFHTRAFPGQNFTGTVTVVSEFIDPATRTIKVRGNVDNTARQLKAEMFVNIELPDQQEKLAASVPIKSVFLKGEKHYVFVEDHPGQFSRHEVQIGAEQGDRISILAGLQVGQRVVSEGCILLQQLLK